MNQGQSCGWPRLPSPYFRWSMIDADTRLAVHCCATPLADPVIAVPLSAARADFSSIEDRFFEVQRPRRGLSARPAMPPPLRHASRQAMPRKIGGRRGQRAGTDVSVGRGRRSGAELVKQKLGAARPISTFCPRMTSKSSCPLGHALVCQGATHGRRYVLPTGAITCRICSRPRQRSIAGCSSASLGPRGDRGRS